MKRPPGPRRKACRKGGDVPWQVNPAQAPPTRGGQVQDVQEGRLLGGLQLLHGLVPQHRGVPWRRQASVKHAGHAQHVGHVAHLPVGVPDVLQERCDGDPARRAQADGPGRGRCQTQAPQVRRSSGSGSGADGCTSRHAPVRSRESGVCGCSLHLTLVFILHPGLQALKHI